MANVMMTDGGSTKSRGEFATVYSYDFDSASWMAFSVEKDSSDPSALEMAQAEIDSVSQSEIEEILGSGAMGEDYSGTSAGSAGSTFKELEYNTLVGELVLRPTAKTVFLKNGDTINVEGIGKYLSGKYYVDTVRRTLSSDGFKITLVVIKTGFGKSVKRTAEELETKDTSRATPEIPNVMTRQYVVKSGDTLYSIAKREYGDSSIADTIAQLNNIKPSEYHTIKIGRILEIP